MPRRIQRPGMFTSGDGSTLSLDFTAMGSLDSRFTFTRNSIGTYTNSSGIVTTMAAAGSNDPTKARFDYDPTTLTPRGLLIEGSASNLFFWSESFATSGAASNWAYNSNTGAIVTSNNPANGTTSFQFAETANSGPLQQSATVTNAVHTFSAWFKASVYNSVTTTQVQFGLYTTAFVAGTASIISGPGSTSVAGNIVTLSGLSETQWTRVQFTTSAAISSGSVAILIYPQTTGFEVNRSFYIWGAQLELGSSASSYIPTGISTAQRATDSCVMSGTNFSSWFNATQGTLLTTWSGTAVTSGRYATINDGSASNQIWTGFNESAIYNGSFQASFGSAGTANGKVALAYLLNDAAWCLNGGSVSTDTSVTLPTGLNQIFIGNSQAGTAAIGTALRTVKYFPLRLTNAQLQAITA
jgi:hypothetical protein